MNELTARQVGIVELGAIDIVGRTVSGHRSWKRILRVKLFQLASLALEIHTGIGRDHERRGCDTMPVTRLTSQLFTITSSTIAKPYLGDGDTHNMRT